MGGAVLSGMPTICVGTMIVKPAQDPTINDSDYAALLSSFLWPYHRVTTADGQIPKEHKMGKLLVDLHLRLTQNRAKQKQLDKRLLLRKKDTQAPTPQIG